MARFHTVTDISTDPPIVTLVAFTPAEETAADAADAAANAEQGRQNALSADSGVVGLVTQLKTATPAQIDTWLANNVTNLTQARTVLGYVIKLLAVALRQQL